jgi:predicted nucleic acid-binding protein
VIVVDTNVLTYFLMPGSATELAQKIRAKDKAWTAPALIRHELLNVLSFYVTQRKLTADEAGRNYRRGLSMVRIWDDEVDPISVLRMADRSGCTTYDMEFVWLAAHLNVPLITADKEVLKAFPAVSVSPESFA